MKLNKILVIALILFALICLPISFASECDVDAMDDASLSLSIDQMNTNANLENNLEINANTNLESNLELDDAIDQSNDLDCEDSILEDYSSDSSMMTNENIDSNNNNIYSNNENIDSNDNLGDANDIDYNSPNLNVDFSNLNVTFTNDNTIFVNASYSGTVESGTVENPFRTFNSAYSLFSNSYNTKTNIFLANGFYQISSTIKINKNVNIVGESTLNTIISGRDNYQIFYISPPQTYGAVSPLVNIFNLTLSNGNSYYGGAVFMNESGVNFVNVNFVNNTARNYTLSYTLNIYSGSGGAVYVCKSFVKFYNSSFIDNIATGDLDSYGGALYNYMGEITIINSRFINNSVLRAYGAGGAIYDYSGILVLFNSTISNNVINSSIGMGGGIATWASHNVYILNSTLDGNSIYGSYTFGSAIINKANNLIISNTTISNNLANGTSDSNGTFFNLNGFVNKSNLQFENNIAKDPQNLFMCLEDQLIIERPFDDASLVDLPSKYDLRDYGWVTPVKDQGGSGSCWAFSTLAALESYLLKYENISYDFSENNMKNQMGYYGLNGTDWTDGGNHYMSLAYLLRWSGPINESDDPFEDYGHTSRPNLKPIKHVQDVLYVPLRLNYLDINQIKAALMTYGALYTTICADNSFQYAPDYYLDIISISNHAITLIGWDDNYSADNFAVRPPGDGAFIIKNSWDTDYGYDGYWYISYYDKTFAGYGLDTLSAMAITNVEDATNYKTNYQYDILGNTFESIGFECSTAWFANQFTAKNNNPLSAFGLYTYGDSDYLVNITVNGVVKYIQEGIIKGAGYHTIKLDEFVELTKGDVFRVAVKLTTPITLFPIAIEAYRSSYSSGADAEEGQSFISSDGIEWNDLANYKPAVKFYEYAYGHTLQKANVCLKAYAVGSADVFLNVKSNASIYYRGDNVQVNLTITNEGDDISDINISAILENGVTVKSALYSKGFFNLATNVWHLDSLSPEESVSLSLKLHINSDNPIVSPTFNFTYSGFIPSNFNTSVSVDLLYGGMTSIVQLENVSTIAKSQDEVLIKLLDWDSVPLANKTIVISLLEREVNGEINPTNNGFAFNPISLVTDEDGNARFILDLISGNYKFLASFYGNGNYGPSNMTFNVSVRESPIISIENNLLNVSEAIRISLMDQEGNALANQTLKILITDSKGKQNSFLTLTNDEGFAELFDLNSGFYNIDVIFEENEEYLESILNSNLTIVKKESRIAYSDMVTTAVDTITDGRAGEYFRIVLKDSEGNALAGKAIQIGFNGQIYDRITDSDGSARIQINLGTVNYYTFAVCFLGDDEYSASFAVAKINVVAQKGTLTVPNKSYKASAKTKTLTATFKSASGKAVKGKKVTFTVNGKTYTATTNAKGVATVKVSLNKKGTYKFTVKFAGDRTYKAISKTGKLTIK